VLVTTEGVAELLLLAFLAAIYVVPAAALFRYDARIRELLHAGGVSELEDAIDAQRGFWQLVGIMTLLAIAGMVALTIITAEVGPVFD
jgi:hypothetical protein